MADFLGTAEVIDRFNLAFTSHDGSFLSELIADDCVMESIEPAPSGTRYEGRDACLQFWRALAADAKSSFTPEETVVCGDRAIIRWRYQFGAGAEQSVRGVNIMRVRQGQVVEALGYAKTGSGGAADAVRDATHDTS